MLHELGHVIGFYHEHSRLDRNAFVRIAPKFKGNINFMMFGPGSMQQYTPAYDYTSIMHYDQHVSVACLIIYYFRSTEMKSSLIVTVSADLHSILGDQTK